MFIFSYSITIKALQSYLHVCLCTGTFQGYYMYLRHFYQMEIDNKCKG